MTSGTPLCYFCEHFFGQDQEPWTCAAFPNGIPEKFVYGGEYHLEAVKGDGGTVFKQSAELDDGEKEFVALVTERAKE